MDKISRGTVLKRRYRVKGQVGEGGFSKVFLAYDTKLRRRVAAKVFAPPDDADDEDARRRFAAEARKLARLASPYVVTIHDTGSRGGVPYFVMEYLPFSVHDLICDQEGDAYPYEDASRILKQTLTALALVHSKKWIHRDIKPENILLTDNDDAKLADFGLVKDPAKPWTMLDAQPGTPGWMAPEQEAGDDATPLSDIYSFGLVAYWVLTGSSWDTRSPNELSVVLKSPLAALLTRCLDDDPSGRPSAQAALDEWMKLDKRFGSQPRRRVRGDARVDTVCTRIARELGLPEGSVRLSYPDNRLLRRNVRISRLRRMWEEADKVDHQGWCPETPG